MKSIQFDFSIPRYAFAKAAGRFFPSVYWNSALSCLRYREVAEPQLPNPDWVKVEVTYGGVCGSDINLISLHDSPSTSPYASFPFTIGHEVVGRITELGAKVQGLAVGDRVVVDPVLSCQARGITEECPACQRGDSSLCDNKTEGAIPPGLLIGACRDTGGSWSSHLVAHQSQIHKLPEEVSDLNGVMVEPFSCALHAVMRNPPREKDTVLVIGAGVIGLCVVAALKALDYPCRIVVVAKHDFQADLSRRFGADEVIRYGQKHYYQELSRVLSAKMLQPILGPPVFQGGADLVFECVGRRQSVDDSLRLAKSGGKVVILGLASIMNKMDWTTIWLNELDVKGSFAYSTEEYQGKRMRTLDIAIDLMRSGRVNLEPLVTHRFALDEYKQALQTATRKGRGEIMKIVFEPALET